ncbi:hypothetical protein [Streptomyces sp. NPDC008317]|uniref:hypothetical protein n=1 Tax=Streptomyces sp. NPDC008317 TaxID=3364827 RepID=UPI0036E48112
MSLTSGPKSPRIPLCQFRELELSVGAKPLRADVRSQHAAAQALMPPPGDDKPYDPENPTDTGYCGGWHRVLMPAHQSSTFTGEGGLTLTRFIVEAAAGERVPFQRGGHHGWLTAQHWQQYLEANGPAPEDKKHLPSVRRGDRLDICTEDRADSEVRAELRQRRGGRTIVLESRPRDTQSPSSVDASGHTIPLCRYGCGQPASLTRPEGLPEHYSCRRKYEARPMDHR